MIFPADIQDVFFRTFNGEIGLLEFEQWVYADTQLKDVLNEEDYLDLISFGYQAGNTKYDLYKLLEKHIDKGAFEKWRILRLLTSARTRDKALPEVLMTFYDLYFKGYRFLDNLSIGYGLAVKAPSKADSWDELTEKQQQTLLDSFYPAIETEIEKVISWLEEGKIVLTGDEGVYDRFDFIDNRTEMDKQPTGYKVATNDDLVKKPWWKFW